MTLRVSLLAACIFAWPIFARADALADIKQRCEMVVCMEAAYVP